jgi:diphthamide biosynthesis protein 3|eukprot:scaffold4058_cov214-Chaetoceros_neogracile.AAC.3
MSIYEEVEIEDLDYDPIELLYTYPCPCGDNFRITLEDLWDGEDIAPCPSCTLRIMIIYEEEDLPPLPEDSDDDSGEESERDEENVNASDNEEKKVESLSTAIKMQLKVQ